MKKKGEHFGNDGSMLKLIGIHKGGVEPKIHNKGDPVTANGGVLLTEEMI